MPELPEVETVRSGLDRAVTGRRIAAVEVHHPRAIRRHGPGAADFAGRLAGRRVLAARRRGKYLWLPLDSGEALTAHLGMSGQLLVQAHDVPDPVHLRVRIDFTDDGPQLRYVDQRTFGGLTVVDLVTEGVTEGVSDGATDGATDGGAGLPSSIAHIARDPMDRLFDSTAFFGALRRRRTGLKRALLDQRLISGVGNIYADEALWRARLHYARPTETLTRREVQGLLDAVREVMTEALRAGGTSFDTLYVAVNGESGWFDRSLAVYGRQGAPCRRCGTPIRRDLFMNRSSFSCPRCQPRPRRARW